MTESEGERVEAVRRQMDGRGYLLRLTTAREGDHLLGRLHVVEAATDRRVATVVASAKVDGLDLVVGIDAPEGVIRDLLSQALSAAELLREALPEIAVREDG